MTILLALTRVMNLGNETGHAFVTGTGPLCDTTTSLFVDHRISGRPILDKCKPFRTICEQNFDVFPNRSHFFFLELVVVKSEHGVATLFYC